MDPYHHSSENPKDDNDKSFSNPYSLVPDQADNMNSLFGTNDNGQTGQNTYSTSSKICIGAGIISLLTLSAYAIYVSLSSETDTKPETQLGINVAFGASLLFQTGMGLISTNNSTLIELGMKKVEKAIQDKLYALSSLHNITTENGARPFENINTVKTYYSQYSDEKGLVPFDIAPRITQWANETGRHKLKIALGVYVFREKVDDCLNELTCSDWTTDQVNAAKRAIDEYPERLHSIVVGNEDAQDKKVASRITQRVEELHDYLTQLSLSDKIRLTTAQTLPFAQSILNNPTANKQFLDALKSYNVQLGINVYPYWGNTKYQDAKQSFKSTWDKLLDQCKQHQLDCISTEEGWPSCGRGNIEQAHDYLYYFAGKKARPAISESYFFQLADKTPTTGAPEERCWGAYSADSGIDGSVSGIDDGQGKLGKKALSSCHQKTTITTNFKSDLLLLACNVMNQCWSIKGYASASKMSGKEGSVFIIDLCGEQYAKLMFIWNLATQHPPEWCEISDVRSTPDNLAICWEKNHKVGECNLQVNQCDSDDTNTVGGLSHRFILNNRTEHIETMNTTNKLRH